MSGPSLNLAGSTAIAQQYSQLATAILGRNSIYQPRGHTALSPTSRDLTVFIPPTNGVQAPAWTEGNKIIYALPKSATLIGKVWHEITFTAGTTTNAYVPAFPNNFEAWAPAGAPAAPYYQVPSAPPGVVPTAAYVEYIGDLILDQRIIRYGSTVLETWNGELVNASRRLRKNTVNIQFINAQILGNLGPGGPGEMTLVDAFYRGVTLVSPLDDLSMFQHPDRFWMPEALALQGQLELVLAGPARCIYTSTGAQGVIAALPTISNVELRYEQIILSAAEKTARLKLYAQPAGLTYLFRDNEVQTGFQLTPTVAAGTAMTFSVPLSNFRMDCAELLFFVRVAQDNRVAALPAGMLYYSGSLADWHSSRMGSNRTSGSTITGFAIGTMLPVTSFKLQAAGKDLFNDEPELFNRTYERHLFHPDSEIRDFIYSRSFAAFPDDDRNASGHVSTSTLGNFTLNITMPSPGPLIVLQVDVYSLVYNIDQYRSGSVAKALN